MSDDRDSTNVVSEILRDLTRWIAALETAGLKDSAALLRIGRLDLEMRLNAISEDELRALCHLIEVRGAPDRSG